MLLGYSPFPRVIKDNKAQPGIKRWQELCHRQATPEELGQWARIKYADVMLACGFNGFCTIDVDVDTLEVHDAIFAALPHCDIGRYGSKGFCLFARFEEGERKGFDIYTGEGSERRPLVEIKGLGRNITPPPSIHDKTGEPYFWFNPQTGEVSSYRPQLTQLPVITPAQLQQLQDNLAPFASKPRVAKERSDIAADVGTVETRRWEQYGKNSLSHMARELSEVKEGARNPKLNDCAFKLGWAIQRC